MKSGFSGPGILDPDMLLAARFNEGFAKEHVDVLAADDKRGRFPGTRSHQAVADYIADFFANHDLQPVSRGNYFQNFTTPVTITEELPALKINGHSRQPYVDFTPHHKSQFGSSHFDINDARQVVYLGACSIPDFNNAGDLNGKIILCDTLDAGATKTAVTEATSRLAAGLLIKKPDSFNDRPGAYAHSGYSYDEEASLPVFGISPEIYNTLLANSSATAGMRATFSRGFAPAQNVLGFLPGNHKDPNIANQIIIVGGHYDHIGTDPDGTIYNGANDCASGVGMILEIIRLWHDQGYHPARSVLFAAWDAEEQGLVGSRHYVDHPIYPLEGQTLAYLNLDMVGLGRQMFINTKELPHSPYNNMRDQLYDSAVLFNISPLPILDEKILADDLPFYEKNIPTGFYSWRTLTLSGHYDAPLLHTPEDDPSMIDLQKYQAIGKLATHVLIKWSSP